MKASREGNTSSPMHEGGSSLATVSVCETVTESYLRAQYSSFQSKRGRRSTKDLSLADETRKTGAVSPREFGTSIGKSKFVYLAALFRGLDGHDQTFSTRSRIC